MTQTVPLLLQINVIYNLRQEQYIYRLLILTEYDHQYSQFLLVVILIMIVWPPTNVQQITKSQLNFFKYNGRYLRKLPSLQCCVLLFNCANDTVVQILARLLINLYKIHIATLPSQVQLIWNDTIFLEQQHSFYNLFSFLVITNIIISDKVAKNIFKNEKII